MVGTLDDVAVRRAQTFSTRAAARILAISPDRIRYWVKRSLVRPLKGGRQMRFGFDDLLVMRLAKELLPDAPSSGPDAPMPGTGARDVRTGAPGHLA